MLALARQADAPEGALEDVAHLPARPPRSQSRRTRRRLRAVHQHEQAQQARSLAQYAQGWAQQGKRKVRQEPRAVRVKRDRWTWITGVMLVLTAALLVWGMARAPRGERGAVTTTGAR